MKDLNKKERKFEVKDTIKIFLPALISLIIVIAITTIFSDVFLTKKNILNVINQAITTGIMGVGVTFIIGSGNIDISSGATACLAGLISANICAKHGVHPFTAIIIALLIGFAIGVLNGFLVAYIGLVPFIATMGTMNILKGISLMYSKSLTVHSIPDLYLMWGGSKVFGTIPTGIIITLILYLLGYLILSKTVFGHRVFAVGGNEEAARLAGIDVKRTVMLTYVLAGLCYAIAGIVLTGRVGAAYPTAAEGAELDVIAGVVIGGTAMSGGRGSHVGTWIGILLVAFINNAINILGISAYATKFVQGTVIIVAVTAEIVRSKMKSKKL